MYMRLMLALDASGGGVTGYLPCMFATGVLEFQVVSSPGCNFCFSGSTISLDFLRLAFFVSFMFVDECKFVRTSSIMNLQNCL
jgi:hypothetical protein